MNPIKFSTSSRGQEIATINGEEYRKVKELTPQHTGYFNYKGNTYAKR